MSETEKAIKAERLRIRRAIAQLVKEARSHFANNKATRYSVNLETIAKIIGK